MAGDCLALAEPGAGPPALALPRRPASDWISNNPTAGG
jgi:hypothetical protein